MVARRKEVEEKKSSVHAGTWKRAFSFARKTHLGREGVTPEIVKRAVGPSFLPRILPFPFVRVLVFSLPRRFRLSSDARCTRSLALFTINYEAVDSQTPS